MAPVSLPYAHCESKLRALAGQAEGFGRLATGGLHGALYCVTTLAGVYINIYTFLITHHTYTFSFHIDHDH